MYKAAAFRTLQEKKRLSYHSSNVMERG